MESNIIWLTTLQFAHNYSNILIFSHSFVSEKLEKQLLDRRNGPQLPNPSFFGESKVRRRSCFIATIKSSVGLVGGLELCSQNFSWLLSASSILTSLCNLKDSSFTASAHSPHSHRPWYLSLTRAM